MTSSLPLVLRNRDFALLWLSQVMSQAGNRMFQIALAWWIISQVGGRAGLLLGAFMVMGALPAILFVRWIGRRVDRLPSRKVLLTSDVGGALVALAAATAFATVEGPMPWLFAAAFFFALFQGFIEPTLNKAVPQLVPPEDLESGVAFLSSTGTLAAFAGAILGALLIETVGVSGVIVLNGLTYVLSAFCDGSIRFPKAAATATPAPAEGDAPAPKIAEGFALLADRPLLKTMLLGFAAVNFFGTPILVVLPLYTKGPLLGDAKLLGLLEATLWIGLLSGTFLSRHFGGRDRAVLFAGLCLAGFGAALALPGLGVPAWAYAILLFASGFSLGLLNVRMITLFQKTVPDDVKGRFFALLQALVSFTVPIGYLVFGVASDHAPVQALCYAQGAGVLALALWFVVLSRREAELAPATPAPAAQPLAAVATS